MSTSKGRKGIDRRTALRALIAGPALALGACATAPLYHATTRRKDGTVLVPSSELARLKPPADALFVQAPGLSHKIALRRVAGEWVAVSSRCTHSGCAVDAVPSGYSCPCHGSSFDTRGVRTGGPAERPLRRYLARSTKAGVEIKVAGKGGQP